VDAVSLSRLHRAVPERQKRLRLDVILYGTALVLALAGGAVAIVDTPPVHVEQPPTLVERRANPPPPPAPEPPPPEAEGPVPDLPEVPDLAAEPPPLPPPSARDPRMRQLGAEMRFLSRARDLLDQHPAEALSVIEQHRRAYPGGILREEREAFALEALVAVGRSDEAERRYYDFTSRYPHSEFKSRLDRIMRAGRD
jgi:hypothetical protein